MIVIEKRERERDRERGRQTDRESITQFDIYAGLV